MRNTKSDLANSVRSQRLIQNLMKCVMVWLLTTNVCFPSPSQADQTADPMEKQLKGALLDAQKSFGVLEPWQKSIYLHDVVPQYQKFIKDYGASSLSKIVVDEESIKRFLVFYGPQLLKKKETRVSILLRPNPTCSKCVESLNAVSDLVQAQIWRRGLTPNLVSTDDLKLPATEVEIQDQVLAISKQKGTDATLVVQWGPAPVDDIDTAHMDDLKFILRTFLQIGESEPILKQREVLGGDSFVVSEASLLVDLFTDLGATLEKEQSKLNEAGKAEILVEVEGIKDFPQLLRTKSQIQALLKEGSTIEERKLAPGLASFAVYSSRSLEDLKTLFLNANLDPGHGERLKVRVTQ